MKILYYLITAIILNMGCVWFAILQVPCIYYTSMKARLWRASLLRRLHDGVATPVWCTMACVCLHVLWYLPPLCSCCCCMYCEYSCGFHKLVPGPLKLHCALEWASVHAFGMELAIVWAFDAQENGFGLHTGFTTLSRITT